MYCLLFRIASSLYPTMPCKDYKTAIDYRRSNRFVKAPQELNPALLRTGVGEWGFLVAGCFRLLKGKHARLRVIVFDQLYFYNDYP